MQWNEEDYGNNEILSERNDELDAGFMGCYLALGYADLGNF